MDPSKSGEEPSPPREEEKREDEEQPEEEEVEQPQAGSSQGEQPGLEPRQPLRTEDLSPETHAAMEEKSRSILISGLTEEAKQTIETGNYDDYEWIPAEIIEDWNRKHPEAPIQILDSEKKTAEKVAQEVVTISDEGSSVDPPSFTGEGTSSEQQVAGVEAQTLPSKGEADESSGSEVVVISSEEDVTKPPPMSFSDLLKPTPEAQQQLQKASQVPLPEEEEELLDYDEEGMDTDARETEAYRDQKALDLSDEEADVTVEDVATDEEEELLRDAGAAPEDDPADQAIMSIKLIDMEEDKPEEVYPLTGTAVSQYTYKREVGPPLCGPHAADPTPIQEKFIQGEGVLVDSKWEKITPITHDQTYGKGQDKMLAELQGAPAGDYRERVSQAIRAAQGSGARISTVYEEDEHTCRINVIAEEHHCKSERPRYEMPGEENLPEEEKMERYQQRVDEASMNVDWVESPTHDKSMYLPHAGPYAELSSAAIKGDSGIIDKLCDGGPALAAVISDLATSQGEQKEPVVQTLVAYDEDDVRANHVLSAHKTPGSARPGLKVNIAQSPRVDVGGTEPLVGDAPFKTPDGRARPVRGTAEVKMDKGKFPLRPDPGPPELLVEMAHQTEAEIVKPRSEPLTEALQNYHREAILKNIEKWGEDNKRTVQKGKRTVHRPPPIYVYGVPRPEDVGPDTHWPATGQVAAKYKWMGEQCPDYIISGIHEYYHHPDQYDPEVRPIGDDGLMERTGAALRVPEDPTGWERGIEAYRLQRDLPEGAATDAKVQKLLADELKAWMDLIHRDGLTEEFMARQMAQIEGRECIVVGDETVKRRFTKFKDAPSPAHFRIRVTGDHYYILPMPPDPDASYADLMECMAAPLLYLWPKGHHPAGPWLRGCSWHRWGHLYPAYMQIWACGTFGPIRPKDKVIEDEGVPMWVMGIYWLKCAHLSTYYHCGLQMVHRGFRAVAACTEISEIYNWINLVQFCVLKTEGMTEDEIKAVTLDAERLRHLNRTQVAKVGTVYVKKEYSELLEVAKATSSRPPPFRPQATEVASCSQQKAEEAKKNVKRVVSCQRHEDKVSIRVTWKAPEEGAHVMDTGTLTIGSTKKGRKSGPSFRTRAQIAAEKERKERGEKRPRSPSREAKSGVPRDDERKPAQRPKFEGQRGRKPQTSQLKEPSPPKRKGPRPPLPKIPQKPAPADYIETYSGLSLAEVQQYVDPPEVAERRKGMEDRDFDKCRPCPTPNAKLDTLRLPIRGSNELRTGRWIWDTNRTEPASRQVILLRGNYQKEGDARTAKHINVRTDVFDEKMEEAIKDLHDGIFGGLKYREHPELWRAVHAMLVKAGHKNLEEPPEAMEVLVEGEAIPGEFASPSRPTGPQEADGSDSSSSVEEETDRDKNRNIPSPSHPGWKRGVYHDDFVNKHASLRSPRPDFHPEQLLWERFTREDERSEEKMKWIKGTAAYIQKRGLWKNWYREDKTVQEINDQHLSQVYKCKFDVCMRKTRGRSLYTFEELMDHLALYHIGWHWMAPCPLMPCFQAGRVNNREVHYTARELMAHLEKHHSAQFAYPESVKIDYKDEKTKKASLKRANNIMARHIVANHWFLFRRREVRNDALLPVTPSRTHPAREKWVEGMNRQDWLNQSFPSEVLPENPKLYGLMLLRMRWAGGKEQTGAKELIEYLSRHAVMVPRTMGITPESRGRYPSAPEARGRSPTPSSSGQKRGRHTSDRSDSRGAPKTSRDEAGERKPKVASIIVRPPPPPAKGPEIRPHVPRQDVEGFELQPHAAKKKFREACKDQKEWEDRVIKEARIKARKEGRQLSERDLRKIVRDSNRESFGGDEDWEPELITAKDPTYRWKLNPNACGSASVPLGERPEYWEQKKKEQEIIEQRRAEEAKAKADETTKSDGRKGKGRGKARGRGKGPARKPSKAEAEKQAAYAATTDTEEAEADPATTEPLVVDPRGSTPPRRVVAEDVDKEIEVDIPVKKDYYFGMQHKLPSSCPSPARPRIHRTYATVTTGDQQKKQFTVKQMTIVTKSGPVTRPVPAEKPSVWERLGKGRVPVSERIAESVKKIQEGKEARLNPPPPPPERKESLEKPPVPPLPEKSPGPMTEKEKMERLKEKVRRDFQKLKEKERQGFLHTKETKPIDRSRNDPIASKKFMNEYLFMTNAQKDLLTQEDYEQYMRNQQAMVDKPRKPLGIEGASTTTTYRPPVPPNTTLEEPYYPPPPPPTGAEAQEGESEQPKSMDQGQEEVEDIRQVEEAAEALRVAQAELEKTTKPPCSTRLDFRDEEDPERIVEVVAPPEVLEQLGVPTDLGAARPRTKAEQLAYDLQKHYDEVKIAEEEAHMALLAAKAKLEAEEREEAEKKELEVKRKEKETAKKEVAKEEAAGKEEEETRKKEEKAKKLADHRRRSQARGEELKNGATSETNGMQSPAERPRPILSSFGFGRGVLPLPETPPNVGRTDWPRYRHDYGINTIGRNGQPERMETEPVPGTGPSVRPGHPLTQTAPEAAGGISFGAESPLPPLETPPLPSSEAARQRQLMPPPSQTVSGRSRQSSGPRPSTRPIQPSPASSTSSQGELRPRLDDIMSSLRRAGLADFVRERDRPGSGMRPPGLPPPGTLTVSPAKCCSRNLCQLLEAGLSEPNPQNPLALEPHLNLPREFHRGLLTTHEKCRQLGEASDEIDQSKFRAEVLQAQGTAVAPTRSLEDELKLWIGENLPGLPDYPPEPESDAKEGGKAGSITEAWKAGRTWYVPDHEREHTGKACTSSYSWPPGKKHTASRYIRMAKEFASAIHDLTFFQNWALKEAEIHEQHERRQRAQYVAKLREVVAVRMGALLHKWYAIEDVLKQVMVWAMDKQQSEEKTITRWSEALTQLVRLQQAYARERDAGGLPDDGSAALLERATMYVKRVQELLCQQDPNVVGTEVMGLLKLILSIFGETFEGVDPTQAGANFPPKPPI